MAVSNKDLANKVDELQTALDAEQQQVADLVAQRDSTITNLEARIAELEAAQGDGGTPEERQAVLDKLNALLDDLKGTVADAEPTPTPEPTPPEEPIA